MNTIVSASFLLSYKKKIFYVIRVLANKTKIKLKVAAAIEFDLKSIASLYDFSKNAKKFSHWKNRNLNSAKGIKKVSSFLVAYKLIPKISSFLLLFSAVTVSNLC